MNQDNSQPDSTLDKEARRRTFNQILDLFVRPELDRRRSNSTLPSPFDLWAFQVLWAEDGLASIRINSEARLLAKMDGPLPKDARIGDLFAPDANTAVEGIELLEHEEGKFAHFTALRTPVKWFYTFDFRYQKDAARAHLSAAEEFFAAADHALAAGHVRAFLDNAHSCLELLTKTDLLLVAQIGKGRMSHPEVRKKAAGFLHLTDSSRLLLQLADLRLPARYLLADLAIGEAELTTMHQALTTFIETARIRTKTYHPARLSDSADVP